MVISLGFVVLLTVANLRGVREASTIFAAPTYLFVTTVGIMLVAGFVQCMDGQCPTAVSSGTTLEAEVAAVGLFLILRAFASGSTALTGVEAIANGVQAFRNPKAHNAATTLGIMGAISITMFLGISTLAQWFDVRITEETIDEYGTVISQIGRAVFDGGARLLCAPGLHGGDPDPRREHRISGLPTSVGHPRPPQADAPPVPQPGDRLVFSNGIVTLAALAALLLVIFGAEVSRLIQLYVVGVFTAFTLSQTGMVRHWLKVRGPGWRRSVVINMVGGLTTGVVLIVVATVKFVHGAWIVILLMPMLVVLMLSIRGHYRGVGAQLKQVPVEAEPRPTRVLVLVAHHDEAADRALRYAQLITAEAVTVVHAEEAWSDDLIYTWDTAHPDRPLEVLPGERESISRRVVARIQRERAGHPGTVITVVLADRVRTRSILAPFAHRHSLAIKSRLLFEPGVVVTDLNVLRRSRRSRLKHAPIAHVEQVVLDLRHDPADQRGLDLCPGSGPAGDCRAHRRRRTAAGTGGGRMGRRGLRVPARGASQPLSEHRRPDGPLPAGASPHRRAGHIDLRCHPRIRRAGPHHPTAPQPDGSGDQGHPRKRGRDRRHLGALPPPGKREDVNPRRSGASNASNRLLVVDGTCIPRL